MIYIWGSRRNIMSKAKLYAIEVYIGGTMLESKCHICDELDENRLYAIFRHYLENKTLTKWHSFDLCIRCYKKKIKNKPLRKLTKIIPLIKMKGKEMDSKTRTVEDAKSQRTKEEYIETQKAIYILHDDDDVLGEVEYE